MLISLPRKNGKFPKTTIFQTAGVAQPIELSKICRHFYRAGIIPKIMFFLYSFSFGVVGEPPNSSKVGSNLGFVSKF